MSQLHTQVENTAEMHLSNSQSLREKLLRQLDELDVQLREVRDSVEQLPSDMGDNAESQPPLKQTEERIRRNWWLWNKP